MRLLERLAFKAMPGRSDVAAGVQRALAVMDNGARFMTRREYASSNPAMAAARMPLVAGLWVVAALAVVVLVWGVLVPIESATVAKGKVVLLSSRKTVQHLEGGIIESLLVKEGSVVKAGQPLIRLSKTASASGRDSLQGQLNVARASEARLIALRDGKDEVVFDKDMVEASQKDPELFKTLVAQMRLFASEREVMDAKHAVLDQRIAQSREQIEGFKARIDAVGTQLELYGQEIETVEKLLNKGFATKTRLFELQRSQSDLQGSKGQYESEIAKAQENIAETQMAILDLQKEYETKNSENMRDAQAQIANLRDRLKAAQDVVDRTVIAAPVSGIVTGLKYHTAGGVIQPGTPVMDIIPQDDQLVIEAHVNPNDIAVVHSGLDAKVIFTAYKMRTTPKVPGKVTQVSADSFSAPNGGPGNAYYLARVEVDKQFLQQMSTKVELYPGMPADIMIRNGSRSFLGYLFKPVTDSMHRAFREQ